MSKIKIPRTVKKNIKKTLINIKSESQGNDLKKPVQSKNQLKETAKDMIADGERSQKTFNWNFKVGDLVLAKSDNIVGIVIRIDEIDEGYTIKVVNQRFEISTARGNYWVGGKNLRIIQKSCKS